MGTSGSTEGEAWSQVPACRDLFTQLYPLLVTEYSQLVKTEARDAAGRDYALAPGGPPRRPRGPDRVGARLLLARIINDMLTGPCAGLSAGVREHVWTTLLAELRGRCVLGDESGEAREYVPLQWLGSGWTKQRESQWWMGGERPRLETDVDLWLPVEKRPWPGIAGLTLGYNEETAFWMVRLPRDLDPDLRDPSTAHRTLTREALRDRIAGCTVLPRTWQKAATPPPTTTSATIRVLQFNTLADGLAELGGFVTVDGGGASYPLLRTVAYTPPGATEAWPPESLFSLQFKLPPAELEALRQANQAVFDAAEAWDASMLANQAPILGWDARKWALLRVITEHNPDIVVLEEVDHFADWFYPALHTLGYQGVFHGDLNGAAYRTPLGKEGWHHLSRTMGNAAFWQASRFQLVEDQSPAMNSVKSVAVRLRDTTVQRDLLLCGLHLWAGEGARAVTDRNTQVQAILSSSKPIRSGAVIVAGDFNADEGEPCITTLHGAGYRSACPPDERTTVKERMGRAAIQCPAGITDFRGCQNKSERKERTIDYILHSDEFAVVAHLRTPTDATGGSIPQRQYPSDHFCLVADLTWDPRQPRASYPAKRRRLGALTEDLE